MAFLAAKHAGTRSGRSTWLRADKHATSVGMYLRTTRRRNKDGSVVRYYALAENVRHPEKGYVEARVVHNFGRADRLDRAALERLVASIRRVLAGEAGGPLVPPAAADIPHEGGL